MTYFHNKFTLFIFLERFKAYKSKIMLKAIKERVGKNFHFKTQKKLLNT